MTSNFSKGKERERELAAWMIAQIKAYDCGMLEPRQVAALDAAVPGWNNEDNRFRFGLIADWSEKRMIAYLGANIDAHDAGIISRQHKAMLDRAMSDWNSVNRPGVSGDSEPWKGWGHVRSYVEEVPGRAA